MSMFEKTDHITARQVPEARNGEHEQEAVVGLRNPLNAHVCCWA
jgi:hypothetical protein